MKPIIRYSPYLYRRYIIFARNQKIIIMKFTFIYVQHLRAFFSLAVQPLSAGKKRKFKPGTKAAFGVWDDVDKGATVESLILWMKPFDEAGIKNYYMCGSPEEVGALY